MAGRPAILKVDIVADAKGVGPGVSEAESKFSKFGNTARKVGKAAALGLGAAAVAAAGVAKASIDAASKTQQAYGALETIYGRNADQVKRWAESAADSVGLAKSEYAELSSLVGSQLQNMGMRQEESARRSDKLIRLGADLAATYGGSVADAVSAVSSLMKGEADPIERYGVGIKKADVNARLAAEGLDGLTGKALKQAEAQTLLTMLTEQTAKTQGAFGRESNTLAGQQERLRAKFENLKSTLGEKLLPVATKVLSWVNRLFDGSGGLGKVLTNRLAPAFRTVSSFISEKVIPTAQRIHSWFVEKIAPGIRAYLTPVVEGLRRGFAKLQEAVERNRPQLEKLLAAVRKVAEFLAKHVLPVLGKVAGEGFRVMASAIGGAIDALGWFIDKIDAAIGKVRDLIGWVSNLKVPDLNPFGKGSAGVLTVEGSGLATGAGALSGWETFMRSGASSPLAQVVTIDARTILQVSTDGLTDEAALARKLDGILTRHARRMGRSTVLSLG